ncbi:hypothetical protein CCACVL1_12874 [Corchorus capsularis]|uniref:START domain-containing protein n=1 Tax=Corchorus capsularis TaxID=210143 RepID=A0A1R3IDB6_COCAP|nr:hypothetical protein CCACVL1_12874 [Corchorus capsularis]
MEGDNGANWSDDSSQEDHNLLDDLYFNGGSYHTENGLDNDESDADSIEVLPEAYVYSVEIDNNLLGLYQTDDEMNDNNDQEDEDDVSGSGEYEADDEDHEYEEGSDNEDSDSLLVNNPDDQSELNSPDSYSFPNVSHVHHMQRASDLLMAVSLGSEPNKSRIIKQATDSMLELVKMATTSDPLWQRRGTGEMEILNGLQYLRQFGSFDSTMEAIIKMVENGEHQLSQNHDPLENQNMPPLATILAFEPLHIEATREFGFVNATAPTIVKLFMDMDLWCNAFPTIVARATPLGILQHGVPADNYDGMLKVMTAEFHQSSPLVPARQSYFARHSKRLTNGSWAVVDVSLESLFPYPHVQFRRRPSGCLIQEIPNGVSMVTWVEHVESDNRWVHPIFQPIVNSGLAFGAQRWVAMINRHCHWTEALMDRTIYRDPAAFFPRAGRNSLLRVAERMTRGFFKNISSCSDNANAWLPLPAPISGNEDIRFRFGDLLILPGRDARSTVIFTTSLRLPVPPKILFDFLADYRMRVQWDLLSDDRFVQELGYVRTGEIPENKVSVLQVKFANAIEILYIQENFADPTGSYVVFAPVDTAAMSAIMNGENPELVTIMPSGFSILPDKAPGNGPVGSILTIAFKTADNHLSSENYVPAEVLRTIDGVLTTTIYKIRKAFFADNDV